MLRTREEELGHLREEYQQLKEAIEGHQREDDASAQQLRSKDQEILQLKVRIRRVVNSMDAPLPMLSCSARLRRLHLVSSTCGAAARSSPTAELPE